MKEMIAKIMLIGVIVSGIGYYIYTSLWSNVSEVDTRATTTITNTSIPTS